MRTLLFNLQQVDEDEANEVRQLLHDNGIRFYETEAGRWRIGLAAIWLPDHSQKEEAECLLEDYQQQRYSDFAQQREALKQQSLLAGMQERFYSQPMKFVAAISGIALVLSISILPFIF